MDRKIVRVDRRVAGAGAKMIGMKFEETGADLKTVLIDQEKVDSD